MASEMIYIGRKPCGCFVMAVPDDPRHAAEVAAAIRDGYTVERVNTAYVREHWRSRCPVCQPAQQEVMEL